MAWTAAAILGSAVVGGLASNSAANKAAKASQSATDQSTALLQQQQAQTRADLAPYTQAGVTAVGAVSDRLGLGPKPAAPIQGGINTQAYLQNNPDVAQAFEQQRAQGYQGDASTFAQQHFDQYGKTEGRTGEMMPAAPAAQMPVEPGTFGQTQNPTYQEPAPYTAPPAYQAPTAYQAPAYTAPEAYKAADYQAPEAFKYTAEDYKASPAYQYTVDQAMKGVLASSAATGALQSGAALKALQSRASNLAYQDFSSERAAAFGQYTDQRNFGRGNYETDRNYGQSAYTDARNFGRGTYETDRSYGQNAYTDARDFGRGSYDADRNYGRSTYETDRAYGRGNYETDRNYLTNRYDNQTNNLFQLGGMGQASASQTANMGANTTTGLVNALNNNAANKGNAAIAGANSFNSFLQSGVSALSYQQGQNALKKPGGAGSGGAYSNPYASTGLWT